MFTAICKAALFFSVLFSAGVWASPKKLNTARKLYKEGKYLAAAAAYEDIDLEAKEYLRSREELAWAYLRAGDWSKLRGVLTHLNSDLVPLRWRLEGRVMSAMLALRECQYDTVKTEIGKFQSEIAPILRKVSRLSEKSPNAPYWRNLQAEIGESILKMKFVKMELRSRLVMLTRDQVIEGQSTRGSIDAIPATAQTFPLNGDLWADEIFKAQGEGLSACADIHKKKVAR